MAVSGAVLDNTCFQCFSDELTFSRSKFLVLLGCNPWYSTYVISREDEVPLSSLGNI